VAAGGPYLPLSDYIRCRSLILAARPLRLPHLRGPEGQSRAFPQIAVSHFDVPVLGQLTPTQLPLGDPLKACSLQVVRLNATLGYEAVEQQAPLTGAMDRA